LRWEEAAEELKGLFTKKKKEQARGATPREKGESVHLSADGGQGGWVEDIRAAPGAEREKSPEKQTTFRRS